MKSGLAARTAVLRLLKNSLQAEQKTLGRALNDDEALKVLRREAKQRKDSIIQYSRGGRPDLAESEQHELDTIEAYLPPQMSESDLQELVNRVVAETGAVSLADMGVVIGAVMKQAGAAADGSDAARLVREKLGDAAKS